MVYNPRNHPEHKHTSGVPSTRVPHPMRLLDRVDDAQAKIDQLNAMLDHHERLATLGTVAALIAHEFNNILTPVLSYSQMALGCPDDRELATKALTKAADGAERAAAIAAAILGFARDEGLSLQTGRSTGCDVPRGTSSAAAESDSGGADTDISPRCGVREALTAALSCLARDPQKDGIQVEIDVASDVAAAIKPVTLQHVLLNLVLNSRNAMLPGGGALKARVTRHKAMPVCPAGGISSLDPVDQPFPGDDEVELDGAPHTGDWILLEVEDSGRGMTPEHLAHLFRPFYSRGTRAADQDPSSPDRRASGGDAGPRRGGERRGTGLGMTICKRLLAHAGAWMWVTSRPGQGTTAGIVMPAAD